jgi:antitoxin ParD1/3/4
MHVLLSPELERLVTEKVASGMYPSADERDQQRHAQQEELRHEIQIGLDQLDAGEFSTYDDQTLPKLAIEIKAEGRQKRARVSRASIE